MSGFLGVLLASSGGLLQGCGGAGLNNFSAASGIRTATLSLNSDGSWGTTGSSSGSGNWFLPTTTGIGSSYWVYVTTSGSTNTTIAGTLNSWVQLTSGSSWTVSNSGTNLEGTGTFTFQFAASSGGTVLVSSNVAWDVGQTH